MPNGKHVLVLFSRLVLVLWMVLWVKLDETVDNGWSGRVVTNGTLCIQQGLVTIGRWVVSDAVWRRMYVKHVEALANHLEATKQPRLGGMKPGRDKKRRKNERAKKRRIVRRWERMAQDAVQHRNDLVQWARTFTSPLGSAIATAYKPLVPGWEEIKHRTLARLFRRKSFRALRPNVKLRVYMDIAERAAHPNERFTTLLSYYRVLFIVVIGLVILAHVDPVAELNKQIGIWGATVWCAEPAKSAGAIRILDAVTGEIMSGLVAEWMSSVSRGRQGNPYRE